GLSRDDGEHLAAMAAGIQSLARGAGKRFGGGVGEPGLRPGARHGEGGERLDGTLVGVQRGEHVGTEVGALRAVHRLAQVVSDAFRVALETGQTVGAAAVLVGGLVTAGLLRRADRIR
ncbi:roadblock/LC7 domain-containing protein, partial [Micromonospora purpureochromogenes]|uniref:roadblock/LC7 domain-containing protein n=1 Tax=Micromonospora purpureochromogenes TaxID=47872 RepID=UPI0033180E2A